MSDCCGNVIGGCRRAQRFPVRFTVSYRTSGDEGWYEGVTDNISKSGLLFRTEHILAPNTPIELRFLLPVTISDEPPAEIVCRGRIVRTAPTSEARSSAILGATITAYFVRRGGVPRNGRDKTLWETA
jgi:hypothetical protein